MVIFHLIFATRRNSDIYTFNIIGPLVNEIHQVVNEWVTQIIRIYKGKNYIEFNWLVGPIPVELI